MTDELSEHLAAEYEVSEGFQCDTDEKATWALEKLTAAQAELDRLKLLAAARIRRIEEWETEAARGPQYDIDFFTGMLTGYRLHLEDADPDLPKTYKVPGGSLARRVGRKSIKVVDEDAFVTWAHSAAPEALTIKPRVSEMVNWGRDEVAGFTVIVSPDGEQVPGVEEVRAADRVQVRADVPAGEF